MADANHNEVEKPEGATAVKNKPAPLKPRLLPPFRLVLHNDEVNDMEDIVDAIVELTPLSTQEAELKMIEAHRTGAAVLLATHKERGELYVDQFATMRINTSLESDE
jgi:ATP-dependent Clp protease adaptor protein ClpS